jgi:hypothetical protein
MAATMAAMKNRTTGFLFTDDLSGKSRVQENAMIATLKRRAIQYPVRLAARIAAQIALVSLRAQLAVVRFL